MNGNLNGQKPHDWRTRVYEVVYEATTPAGFFFDVFLIIAIILSVLAVMLESVPAFDASFGAQLRLLEWAFTVLFSIEYVLRIIAIRKPWRYVTSFFGVIDLLSILPTYIGLLFGGAHAFLVLRVLRLVRLFRVFKMVRFLGQAAMLSGSLRRSMPKIGVFLLVLSLITIITGALMYLVEGPANGFTSIPLSIYWAITTLTTVGFGDVTPHTTLGRAFASILMIMGYAIIAVPTGLLSYEIAHSSASTNNEACPSCGKEGHADDAKFCKYCGSRL